MPFTLLPDGVDRDVLVKEFVLPVIGVPSDQVIDILPANQFQRDCMNSTTEPFGLQYAYMDIQPHISWEKLVSSCRKAVQSFEGMRSQFVKNGNDYYQVTLRDAPLLVEEISTTEQMTKFCNEYCLNDPRKAVIGDITTKLTLVHIGRSRRRVIMRISHAQYDGWCTEQVFRALEATYNDEDLLPTPPFSQLLHHRSL
ncbi:hypothetical protein P153DRAFT_253591, partial [Dothidotthia symphoricarpi CBS 119687]